MAIPAITDQARVPAITLRSRSASQCPRPRRRSSGKLPLSSGGFLRLQEMARGP